MNGRSCALIAISFAMMMPTTAGAHMLEIRTTMKSMSLSLARGVAFSESYANGPSRMTFSTAAVTSGTLVPPAYKVSVKPCAHVAFTEGRSRRIDSSMEQSGNGELDHLTEIVIVEATTAKVHHRCQSLQVHGALLCRKVGGGGHDGLHLTVVERD